MGNILGFPGFELESLSKSATIRDNLKPQKSLFIGEMSCLLEHRVQAEKKKKNNSSPNHSVLKIFAQTPS